MSVPGLVQGPLSVIGQGADLAGSMARRAGELVAEVREDVVEIVEEGEHLVEETVGLHRRVWEDPEHGHAQIEARAIDEPRAAGLRERLKQSLEQLDAVQWAEVNAVTKRVAVSFSDSTRPLGAVIGVIESVERAHGIRRGRRDEAAGRTWDVAERADHPADVEPVHRVVAALAGDTIGLGWSLLGRVTRLPRAPIEAASIFALLENTPWLRVHAERLLGRRVTDLVVPLANAAANGVAQGAGGILVDMAYRATLLTELQARREVWERRESEFYADPSTKPIHPPDLEPRPMPLPDGPVEAWSARIALASLAGFAATLAATRDPRRAADAFLAGIPKAAQLGREGFAAQLARTLAARGVLPLDASALRRLDRVDTVVIDRDALVTGHVALTGVVSLGQVPEERLRDLALRLLDPGHPRARRTENEWTLQPFTSLDEGATIPRGGTSRARALRAGGGLVLALRRHDQVEGLAGVVPVLEAGAPILVEAVRRSGHRLVVAGRRGGVGKLVRADAVIPRGKRMGAAIRKLQAEGAVVAALGRRGKTGLSAADVAIGLVRPSGRPPWGADLVCGRNLVETAFLIEATAVAAQVSHRSADLALVGSTLGSIAAITGPKTTAGRRSLTMVNSAAAVSLAAGTWAGLQLARRPQRATAAPSAPPALPAPPTLDPVPAQGRS